MAQSWGTAAVSGLNVLPEPLQEYANSIRLGCPLLASIDQDHRAVAVARVPPTALAVNGAPQGRMYLAGVLESAPHLPSEGRDEPRLSEDATISAENLEGQKVYKIVVVTKTKQLFRYLTPPPHPPPSSILLDV
jgi:hypothetical protein